MSDDFSLSDSPQVRPFWALERRRQAVEAARHSGFRRTGGSRDRAGRDRRRAPRGVRAAAAGTGGVRGSRHAAQGRTRAPNAAYARSLCLRISLRIRHQFSGPGLIPAISRHSGERIGASSVISALPLRVVLRGIFRLDPRSSPAACLWLAPGGTVSFHAAAELMTPGLSPGRLSGLAPAAAGNPQRLHHSTAFCHCHSLAAGEPQT